MTYTSDNRHIASVTDGRGNTVNYQYDTNNRLLTSYNGQAITYDAMGNPLTYKGMAMTWEKGRQLKSITKDGVTYSFIYDNSGRRIQKQNGTQTVRYYWNGSQLMAMQKGDSFVQFAYDEAGKAISMTVNGTTYYYLYNLQRDVVGLLDASGTQVVSYKYNSWGRLLSMTDSSGIQLGVLNPFRYRGYVYDDETGLYYVGSRYYDPEVGRWINADSVLSMDNDFSSMNLYVYCGNNPVNRDDIGGYAWKDVKAWFSNAYKKAKEALEKVRSNIFKNCGMAAIVDREIASNTYRFGVAKAEVGTGYNKSFDTGKAVNVYKVMPNSLMELGESGSGIDVNVNGYGGSVQLGNEKAITLHFKDTSVEWGNNIFGTNYVKYSYTNEAGGYSYYKFSVNSLELGAVAILSYALATVNVGTVAVKVPALIK